MDLWRGALPAGTDLLGGRGGLERQVDGATSRRTRPPAFEAIKGGEIAFIAVRSIKLLDERLDLTRVLESFADKGGVAAAVVGDVAAASIELAARRDRAQELQTELMELALNGAGPAGIVDRLSELLELAAAWQDESGELRHEAGAIPATVAADPWTAEMPAVRRFADSSVVLAANPPVREFSVGAPGFARVVAPIPLRGGVR